MIRSFQERDYNEAEYTDGVEESNTEILNENQSRENLERSMIFFFYSLNLTRLCLSRSYVVQVRNDRSVRSKVKKAKDRKEL